MTVGKLVEARANALGTGICISAPGDEAVVPATVPPHMVEEILRSLGIWDAEVLEFELRRDKDDPDVFWWHCDETGSWVGSSVFEVFDGPSGDCVGDRISIIVLPKKEIPDDEPC